MFSLFRKSQDTKKILVNDKEADGFVFLGNTINEEGKSSADKNSLSGIETKFDHGSQDCCYDDKMRGYLQYIPPLAARGKANSTSQSKLTETDTDLETDKNQNMEHSSMLEFLSDVPFTLAPHVLAVQDICNSFSKQLFSCDVNENLTKFWYDFTLENSVLCDS